MGPMWYTVHSHRISRVMMMMWMILIITCGCGMTSVKGRFPPHKPMMTQYACENGKLRISCLDGQVIRIMRANYGRFSVSVCNPFGITDGWNLQCMSFRSLEIISERCDGRQSCEMMANNYEFGDPCPGTSKYAEVKYFCQGEESETKTVITTPTTSTTTTATTTTTSTTTTTTISTTTTPSTTTLTSTTTKTSPTTTTSTTTTTTTSFITYPRTDTTTKTTTAKIFPRPNQNTLPSAATKMVASAATSTQYTKPPTVKISTKTTTTTTEPSTTSSTTISTRKTTPVPRTITVKPRKTTRAPFFTTKDSDPGMANFEMRYCQATRVDGVWWPRTSIGHWADQQCPDNLKGTARWLCSRNGWTGAPDLSDCVSPWVEQLDKKIEDLLQGGVSDTNPVEILENLTDITSVKTGDLKRTMIKLMPKLRNVLQNDVDEENIPPLIKKKKVKRFSKSLLKTSSNLLAKKQKNSWRDLPSPYRMQAATQLMITVEVSAYTIAEYVDVGTTDTVVNDNIMVEVSAVDGSDTLHDMTFPSANNYAVTSPWSQSSDTITIPKEALAGNVHKGVIKVVFTVYNNINQYINPIPQTRSQSKARDITPDKRKTQSEKYEEETNIISEDRSTPEKKTIVNSNIISASINGREQLDLEKPVEFTLQHHKTEGISNPVCSFWDVDKKTERGHWSGDRCHMIKTNNTHTTCQCDHLTNFAILMDVTGSKLSPGHQLSLRVITFVGCIISIICLFLSWLTFISFKNLQCDRLTIHKHLVFNLMLAEIVFLTGIGQTGNQIFCSIIAGVLHFLFMVAFAWMCLEGIQLYVMLIEVFEQARSRVFWYYAFGYGIPSIIVIVSASVYPEGYGSEIHCWLTTKRNFIWSFVGPVVTVIIVNMIMLSIAIYMMCKHANTATSMKDKTKFQKFRAWIKGAVVLVVLLGLTWAVGLLFLNEETVVMAYLFTVLNSLQGLFIFIFHCIMNDKVQKEYRKVARRTSWLPKCIRVNYGGYTGNLSGSPNPSSGSAHGYFSKLFSGKRRKRSTSTNSSTKPFLSQRGGRDRSSGENSGCRDSSLYPSTINGYIYNANNNDPQKSPRIVSNGVKLLGTCYEEIDGIAGDLSGAFDCSVIDSEMVTEYCNTNMQVCKEKRRYSTESETSQQSSDEEKDKDHLSNLSYESIAKNRESFLSTDPEGTQSDLDADDLEKMKRLSALENEPLVVLHSDSKRNLINSLLSRMSSKKNGIKTSRGKRQQSPSLGNINSNEEKLSEEKINTSTPNLKFKGSSKYSEQENRCKHNGVVLQLSLPNISVTEQDSESDSSFQSPEKNSLKIKRLKSDVMIQMDPHRFDLSSSEC